MKSFILTIIVTIFTFIFWSLDQNHSYAAENWVEVEQTPFVVEKKGESQRIKFLDYVDRRESWNIRITFLGAQSKASNYTLSTTQTSESLNADGVGFEGLISMSYNIGAISAGLDLGLLSGSLSKDVSLFQPKISLHIMADALFNNPYAVPYLKVGGSQMEFSNPSSSDIESVKGNVALFYAFGGMFSLDWFQKTLAMDAYFGYGLETTYFVIEYETFPTVSPELVGALDIKQSNLKFGLQLVF